MLQERIEAFLQSCIALLAELEPQDFEKHRQALIAAKMQQHNSLLEESAVHWEEIQSRRYLYTIFWEGAIHDPVWHLLAMHIVQLDWIILGAFVAVYELLLPETSQEQQHYSQHLCGMQV